MALKDIVAAVAGNKPNTKVGAIVQHLRGGLAATGQDSFTKKSGAGYALGLEAFADDGAAQAQVTGALQDLRGLLASRDLDGIPEIKQLRQRLDDGIQTVRDATVRAAQQAADQARDAARAADRYAHDEPWRVASAALAVGALVGFLLARR